jgi:hypothetical protein
VPVIDKMFGQLREDTAQGVLRTRMELEALLMRPRGDRFVAKSLERLKKRGLIEAFDAEEQRRSDGKPKKVYAAITACLKTSGKVLQTAANEEPSRGDINVCVSHSKEPSSPLGSANATTNATTPPVAFENVHPATESHPSPNEVDEVHPLPMRQPEPVAFEEPSATKGSVECDNFGERVEEAPFEGDLLSTTYSSKSDHLYWPRGGSSATWYPDLCLASYSFCLRSRPTLASA